MGVLDELLGGVKQAGETLKDKAQTVIEDIKDKTTIDEKITEVIDGIKEKGVPTLDEVKEKAADTFETVKDKAGDVMETLKSKAEDFSEILQGDAPNAEVKNEFFTAMEDKAKSRLEDASKKADALDEQMKAMMAKIRGEDKE